MQPHDNILTKLIVAIVIAATPATSPAVQDDDTEVGQVDWGRRGRGSEGGLSSLAACADLVFPRSGFGC